MYKKLKMYLNMYRLAIKYYFQGDSWESAIAFAERIVYGFKKD